MNYLVLYITNLLFFEVINNLVNRIFFFQQSFLGPNQLIKKPYNDLRRIKLVKYFGHYHSLLPQKKAIQLNIFSATKTSEMNLKVSPSFAKSRTASIVSIYSRISSMKNVRPDHFSTQMSACSNESNDYRRRKTDL